MPTRRKRGCKAQNLCFCKADLFACTGETEGHFHDGRFRSGKLVAQIDQRRAKIFKQALIHSHDVGELRQRRARFLGDNIGGVAKVDHDAGKGFQRIRLNAQLTGIRHDIGDFRRVGRRSPWTCA